MDLIDIENREKAVEEKFRVFRNIYRTPLLAGLPWNVFVYFFIAAVIGVFVMLGCALGGRYIVAAIVFLAISGLYYVLRDLTKKHGPNFLDKSGSFYTMNTFNEVRVNRKIENVVINHKKDHGKD